MNLYIKSKFYTIGGSFSRGTTDNIETSVSSSNRLKRTDVSLSNLRGRISSYSKSKYFTRKNSTSDSFALP